MPYMKDEGNLVKNREYYLRTRFPNLTYLFEKRFHWMDSYIKPTDEVLEVGCGIGVTKLFVKNGNLTLSDVIDCPWIDAKEDALNLSYEDRSLDVIIANNMIHHLAHPVKFFQETDRVLKQGGRLLIQDINCSFFMQRLLRFMHVEDFNFKVDVFNIDEICTNVENPWDGNNAIPNLLFDDVDKFEDCIPYFKIVEKKKSEFFVYILSGGISGKTFTIPLPFLALKIFDTIDSLLSLFMSSIFSLQMRIVLEKK